MWRFAARVVCVACVIAAAAGCRDEEDRKPSGTLVLQLLRPGEPLAAVDLPAGKPSIARGLALAGGDPPLRVLRTGGRLVYYGAGGVYAIDLELKRSPRKLGGGLVLRRLGDGRARVAGLPGP